MLNIGITSRSYSGLTICDTALDMADKGFKCTELCFTHPELPGWTYNGIGSLEGITPKKVARLILQNVDALRKAGITAAIRRSNGKRIIQLTSADRDDNEAHKEIGTIDPVDQLAEGNAEGSDNGDSSL